MASDFHSRCYDAVLTVSSGEPVTGLVGYGTFAPPLTLITSPTTKLDSGEARKT